MALMIAARRSASGGGDGLGDLRLYQARDPEVVIAEMRAKATVTT
jgi:hypothetical protein